MRHIPNVLSGLRIAMVGVFAYFFLNDKYIAALIVYVLAALTDLLDGYLARRNNWITDVGKVLDPLADKLMLICALVCFYMKEWLPFWLVAIVVGKELLMILGGMLLYKHKYVVYADWFGKCATLFFNAGIVATFLKGFWPWIGVWNVILLSIAVVMAIVALFHYAGKNMLPHVKQAVEEKKKHAEEDKDKTKDKE
ncbi:CDP-alcohol phosphatidyltransferase family protein [Christensenellaceae bacterium OttesenSCG-928-M15]|nr:CDP-alcohol phosphatidyltransferase family protein [Christensenellaceae bacterium OttesenSCG-928-M15]